MNISKLSNPVYFSGEQKTKLPEGKFWEAILQDRHKELMNYDMDDVLERFKQEIKNDRASSQIYLVANLKKIAKEGNEKAQNLLDDFRTNPEYGSFVNELAVDDAKKLRERNEYWAKKRQEAEERLTGIGKTTTAPADAGNQIDCFA